MPISSDANGGPGRAGTKSRSLNYKAFSELRFACNLDSSLTEYTSSRSLQFRKLVSRSELYQLKHHHSETASPTIQIRTASLAMATQAVHSPSPVNNGEPKSSRKKKAKEGGANGSTVTPAVPDTSNKESSSHDPKGEDGVYEHPYIKELAKHIRNTHKKLAGMQKTDAVIAENPDVSLDDLVAQRKINNDQKAAALKKPQLHQQLAGFEEQISQYRKFDAEYQTLLQKQKDDLTSQHQKELEKVKDELRVDGVTAGAAELKKNLLVFSQFLRAAAAKRTVEEESNTDESRAFEGALLLVYGGDETAVETAMKLIEGADEQVPGIDGVLLPVKCKYNRTTLMVTTRGHVPPYLFGVTLELTHAQIRKSNKPQSITHHSKPRRLGLTPSQRRTLQLQRPRLCRTQQSPMPD